MTETTKIDYSKTLYLPQTEFPMRAGLPQREPVFVERWEGMNLYKSCASRPRIARSMCCTTVRPTPTAISISATR